MPWSPARLRRRALIAGAGLTALASTLPHPAWAEPDPDREPSGTELRTIDDTVVVFSYGTVLPSLDGWATHEPTRDYLGLDGRWKFAYDRDGTGEAAGWQRPGFDDDGWGTIAVPSSWDLRDNDGWDGYDGADFGKGGSLIDGYGWYRTRVEIPAGWRGRHVRLAFLGAFYRADAWVNGSRLGTHEGGHTPFALPVDGAALRPGRTATIVVRVHRAATYTAYDGTGRPIADDRALPSGPVDYWPYAGLTRSLWLEAVPAVTVAKLLLNADGPTLDARAVIENHGDRPFRGKITLDPGRRTGGRPVTLTVEVPAGGVAVPAAELPIPRAPAWSPANPTVLRATATITGTAGGPVTDTLSSTYGRRTVEAGQDQLLLNGKPVFLKGYNWHEETDRSGRSLTRAEYDHELGHAKQLGANLLRNAVYQRHPYVTDWADRNGMLQLDEWDTMWISEAQQAIQLDYGLSAALAAATVWNNHNHPSVIMWGLQNECTPNTPTYRAWLAQMRDAVKAVDLADRPVTWASATSWDEAFDLADVVGFNEYFGYFYGKNEDLTPTLDQVHANHPGKPILITENGTWSFWGNHGDPAEAGTEEHHAAYFQAHWDQVVAKPYVAGYAFWVLKDYKQRRNYNMNLNGLSYMGMLRWDGDTPRVVYDTFRAAQPPGWSR